MPSLPRLSPRQVRWIRRGLVFAGFAFLVLFFRRPLFQSNFGVVDPGKVFRSSQPTGSFEETIRRIQLGSVVNLRGGSATDDFYKHEVETARRLGLEFYDLPISATRRPSRRELMMALSVLDRCRYPLLIHCKWGADRTGLLTALYRLVNLGEPPEKAITAFTLTHGHFAIFGPEKLHEPIDEYAEWLKSNGLDHSAARFRMWLEQEYRSTDPFVEWPKIKPGPRPIHLW